MDKHDRLIRKLLLAVALVASGPAWAYDTALAGHFAQLFEPVKGTEASKALQLVKPEDFVNSMKAKEAMQIIDIRTPAETGYYGLNLPDSVAIPVNELFLKDNLDRLAADRPVVIVCLSGTRAMAAGIALRAIGFDNTLYLSR